MKIEQGPFKLLAELTPELNKQALQGRFYNLKRVIVLEAEGEFYAVTFTIFERIKAAFLKIVGKDYFKDVLGKKDCKVVDCKRLQNIPQKIAPVVNPAQPVKPPAAPAPVNGQAAAPAAPPAAANVQVAAPAAVPVVVNVQAAAPAAAPVAANIQAAAPSATPAAANVQAAAPAAAPAAANVQAAAPQLSAGIQEWVDYIQRLIQNRPNNHAIYLDDLCVLGMGRHRDVMDAINHMLNVEHSIYARTIGRGGNPLIKVRQDDVVTEPEYDQGWMTGAPGNLLPQAMPAPVPVAAAVARQLSAGAKEWVDHIKGLIQNRPNNNVIFLDNLCVLGMGRHQDVMDAIDYMLNVEHSIYARGLGRGAGPLIKVRQDDVMTEPEFDNNWILSTKP